MNVKLIIFVSLITLSFGCLITNCPRGGKRGDPAMMENVRECTACGRDDQGQCFGPQICCGTTIGCLIGTHETLRCRKESLFSRPCIAGFDMCRGNTGRCAADGICCTQESCFIDPTCKLKDENDRKINDDFNTFLLGANSNDRIL